MAKVNKRKVIADVTQELTSKTSDILRMLGAGKPAFVTIAWFGNELLVVFHRILKPKLLSASLEDDVAQAVAKEIGYDPKAKDADARKEFDAILKELQPYTKRLRGMARLNEDAAGKEAITFYLQRSPEGERELVAWLRPLLKTANITFEVGDPDD